MARPKTGETPPAERQAATKARLAASGGKRVSINLTGAAIEATRQIIAAGHATDTTSAIHHALARCLDPAPGAGIRSKVESRNR